jgi:hypothetical protein
MTNIEDKLCPHCMSYLEDRQASNPLDPNLIGWKRCPTCGWCKNIFIETTTERHLCKESAQSDIEKHEADSN